MSENGDSQSRGGKLASAFDVRPGEGPLLALLCLHAFCMGLGFVFFETPANALYLTRFGADTLPYVYVLTAMVSVTTGILYTRLERRLAPGRLFRWTLLGLATACACFYFAQRIYASRWLAMGMMVWKDVLWVLSGLELWAVAGMLLNARQGKRLFGLVASGEVLAVIVGGLSIPLFTARLGTEGLLLLSFIAELASVLVLARITAMAPETLGDEVGGGGGADEGMPASLPALLRDPYVALFFTASVLSFLGQYVLDFLFFHQVESAYPSETQVAAFFGSFFAALGGVNLFFNAFVTGPLLTRWGIGAGLLALPVTVSLGTLVAIAGRNAPPGMEVIFWAVVATKLLDEVLRKAIEGPTNRILYQPLPGAIRLRVQTWRESVVEPSAVGFSGALLLILSRGLQVDTATFTFVLAGVLVCWIAVVVALRQSYTRQLTRALERRSFPAEDLTLDDPAFVDLLRKGLKSDQPADVIYSLELLERLEVTNHEEILGKLLEHASPRVRSHALHHIGALGFTGLAEKVAERAREDEDPALRGRAIRTLGVLLADEGVERLSLAMDAGHPEVREGAMVGLLRHGGIDGILAAGRRVQGLAGSRDASERRDAARVLGEVGITSFYRPLVPLMQDEVSSVRREALLAAGKLRNPRLAPLLLENLEVPGMAAVAAGSLAHLGDPALPALRQAFEKAPPEGDRRRRLLEIMGKIGGDAARVALAPHLTEHHPTLRQQATRSLQDCGYRILNRKRLEGLLKVEVVDTAWNYAAFLDVNGKPGCEALSDALIAHARRRREHVVRLMALHYPALRPGKLVPRMMSTSATQRAYALEVMDNLIHPEVRDLAFPILDDLRPAIRLERLKAPRPRTLEVGARLIDLIRGAGTRATLWIRAAALDAARRRGETSVLEAVRGALESAHPLLRETALATLHALDPDSGLEVASRLEADPSPAVSALARRLGEGEAA